MPNSLFSSGLLLETYLGSQVLSCEQPVTIPHPHSMGLNPIIQDDDTCPPQSGVYQRLPPVTGSGAWKGLPEVRTTALNIWDQLWVINTTTVSELWQTLVEEWDPTAVCAQAGEQQKEEELGFCGCVWFFHVLLRPLFIKLIVKLSKYLAYLGFNHLIQ